MLALASLIPIMRVVVSTLEKHFYAKLLTTGHRAHWALKVILFRKSFRLTNATNKQYSNSEISQIVMHDTNAFWALLNEIPLLFQVIIHLIISAVVIFQ